jgi:hypothetical protein
LRRDQFGGTLGGPIVPGQLFYFGGYQGMIADFGLITSANDPRIVQLALNYAF